MTLSDKLRKILDEQNLTIYGAAQIIGAETDEQLKTVHDRLTRYLERPPKTWTDLEATLSALGYTITIIKRSQRNP